jgi:hypothetical protein
MRESILDDNVLPYRWSDTELMRFLNYAEVQACRRAHLIIDGVNSNDSGTGNWSLGIGGTRGTGGVQPLCSVTLVANQAVYNLSLKILQIKRCQLTSMDYPLIGPVSYSDLDNLLPGWMGTSGTVGTAGTGGYPTFFLNEPGNTITFIKAPSTTDSAKLVVSRLPLIQFNLSTSPEIDERYHIDLCDWAAHLAFNKPDSETINLNLAKMYESKFVEKFGELPNAYSERIRKVLSQKQRMRAREFGS